MKYKILENNGKQTLSVYLPKEGLRVIDESHPNWQRIASGLITRNLSESELADLVDVGSSIAKKLKKVSDRFGYHNSIIYFDGQPINNAIVDHILDKLRNGDKHWKNLAKFMVKLNENQNAAARENLYAWVQSHKATITKDGNLLGYKAVREDGTSKHSGYGIVDGVIYENAHLPHTIGSVVEFPRNMIDETSTACSVGLHVGTYEYASSFAPKLLLVEVNPRDIVGGGAVNDLSFKYRTCRYKVINEGPDAKLTETTYKA